jgi:phosphohistidine phosphatase
MKTLYLVRHGKSSWHYPELNDRERPLKGRGENDAHLMGKVLRKKKAAPDALVSSPARRAQDTAKIFADELRFKGNIHINEALYFHGPSQIMSVVNKTPDDVTQLFLFGHNPDTMDLANMFSGNGYDNVPTCGVVCIEFEAETWKETGTGNGRVKFFDCPSRHK